MKQLAIRELAPYLPYGLKCLINIHRKPPHHIGHMRSLTECLYVNGNAVLAAGFRLENGQGERVPVTKMKPILHPLSDLTKEIEHNGERFVPIYELLQINHTKTFGYRMEVSQSEVFEHDEQGGCLLWDEEKRRYAFTYDNEALQHGFEWSAGGDRLSLDQYEMFGKLLEWKFDLFELLDNDIAVDVNTLERNPYR